MSHLIDILIPTFDNPSYLYPCVRSLLSNVATPGLFKITVVNNGSPESVQGLKDSVHVIQMKENAGWVGGLKAGFEATSAPFVVLCNDDVHVPASSRLWPNQLLQHFIYPDCGGVGPSSNFVMGKQAIWDVGGPTIFRVPFLIGFFFMARREDIIKAGEFDEEFTCGDDLELSLRLRELGKYLLTDKEVFIYHHGAKTGPRIEGNYWYSADQQMKTWDLLFHKHGVRHTFDMLMAPFDPLKDIDKLYPTNDVEGDLVKKFVYGEKVLELGVGSKKTVPQAIGLDRVPKGLQLPGIGNKAYSVADVVADVQEPLPFSTEFDCVIARHILEHTVDPMEALRNWVKVVKHGGRIIIAVPDQRVCNSIPMNPEHLHAFTPDSLRNIAKALGLKEIAIEETGNRISFVAAFERNGNS